MGKTVRAWASITLLSVAAATPAFADANAVARAVSERFARACAAGDIQAVVAMYEDDAIAVWPGEGAEGAGKPAIEKLATGLCTGKASTPVLKSVEGRSLGKGYVVTHGRWELPSTAPDGTKTVAVVRTTEVLKDTGGKWRYVVDHASVGVPPPAAPANTRAH